MSEKKSINIDGLINVYNRQGVNGKDPQTGYRVISNPRVQEREARDIYEGNGFGSKVVDRIVRDMTREWFDVTNDTNGDINKALSDINTKKATIEALTWAFVYGGSVMLMYIDDGAEELEEPLREDNIQTIDSFRVYDRYRVTWTSADLYDDPMSPKFGTPEVYTINPINQGSTQPFRVHETRLLRFDGVLTSEYTYRDNDSWADSFYRKLMQSIVNLTSSYQTTKSIIDGYVQTILKINNLQEMIAAGEDGYVKDRLDLIDLGRHVMNTILLDEGEDFEKLTTNVSGLDKMLQEFQLELAAQADMPLTVLMGRSPAGMSSTGESDIRMYYDSISARQEDMLLDNMRRLVELEMKAKQGPTKGVEIEDWAIEFNPLMQPSEEETVKNRKTQAETDQIYINTGVLDPSEVAVSRFGGSEYSIETTIDEDAREVIPPKPPEETDDTGNNSNNIPDTNTNSDVAQIAGTTSSVNNHRHDYMLTNAVRGTGETGPGGRDGHTHTITDFTVDPYVNPKTGDIHIHTLPDA